MSAWAAWRLVKFTALISMTAGLVSASTASSREKRLRSLYFLGVPGFVSVWVAGWMLTKLTGRSLAEPWIVAGLLGSFSALHGAYLGAFAAPDRERTISIAAPTVFGGLFATVAWMVIRPQAHIDVVLIGALAAFVGSLGGVGLGPTVPRVTARDDQAVLAGFRLVAWLEGASAILLMLVGTGFRAATGNRLDGDTGLLGWTHGVLFLVYLQTLASTARLLSWSRKSVILGVLAAVVPGGTFVFDRLRSD